MREVPINTLRPGEQFTLVLETTGRRIAGELVRINAGSATVKVSGVGQKSFSRLNTETGEVETVQFSVPSSVEHWDMETPVVRMEAENASA